MEKKIKQFFDEVSRGHCNLNLYGELLSEGVAILDYAFKNNRLNEFKLLVTPQKYDDGFVRILYDPFSDPIFDALEKYLFQNTEGIKELIDSLYEIDYEKLFQIRIKDSHARQISGMGHPISGEKDVIYYSEPACLKSMLKLYDLNIDTYANDTEGCIEDGNYVPEDGFKCGINIYYSRLSEENKKIVDILIQDGFVRMSADNNKDIVFLNVKCDREETIGEVSDRLLAVISQLKIQDVKFIEMIDEKSIREAVLSYSKLEYIYSKQCPYDLLARELIKYYEQFSIEEFPERNQAIQDIKDNVYDESALNSYFHQETEFQNQVLRNMISPMAMEECVGILLKNGYYLDEANKQLFSNKTQYLKHLNYMNNRSSKNDIGENPMTPDDGIKNL